MGLDALSEHGKLGMDVSFRREIISSCHSLPCPELITHMLFQTCPSLFFRKPPTGFANLCEQNWRTNNFIPSGHHRIPQTGTIKSPRPTSALRIRILFALINIQRTHASTSLPNSKVPKARPILRRRIIHQHTSHRLLLNQII